MKNPTVLLVVASFLIIVLHQKAPEELRYPKTEMGSVVDTYFDTTIADPYRWLEDDYARETKTWVSKQNAFTNSYMRRIPFRHKIEKRLTEIWNYPSQGAPFKKGDKYYFYKNDGLQNQSVIYVQDSPSSEGKYSWIQINCPMMGRLHWVVRTFLMIINTWDIQLTEPVQIGRNFM